MSIIEKATRNYKVELLTPIINNSFYSEEAKAGLINNIKAKAGVDGYIAGIELESVKGDYGVWDGKNKPLGDWIDTVRSLDTPTDVYEIGYFTKINQPNKFEFQRYNSQSGKMQIINADEAKAGDFAVLKYEQAQIPELNNTAPEKPLTLKPANKIRPEPNLPNGYIYDGKTNLIGVSKVEQDQKSQVLIMDLNQMEIAPIVSQDENGKLQGLSRSHQAEIEKDIQIDGKTADFKAALTGSFVSEYKDENGKRDFEVMGDIYYRGTKVASPKSQNGKSVANHRYMLAITNDNKPEIILGSYPDEKREPEKYNDFKQKYKLVLGGLGLLKAPASDNLPIDNFDKAPDLINERIPPINYDKRYLPLVRDKQSAIDADNFRGAGQPGITTRNAIIITDSGKLAFVQVEDGILIENVEEKINELLAKQGFRAKYILLPDSGVRSRFPIDSSLGDPASTRYIPLEIKSFLATQRSKFSSGEPGDPLNMLGAYKR
jgi:hypothetical protein